jgi:hypothetical protein
MPTLKRLGIFTIGLSLRFQSTDVSQELDADFRCD